MKKGALNKPRRSFDDSDPTEVRGEKISPDNLKQLENDLVILSAKIASLNSNSNGSSNINAPSSCFVSGLRTSVEKHRDDSTTKVKLLESVLARITDLDRAVLRKTELENASQARRSLDGRFDLNSLPTHMHVIDRLIDYHSQAKRIHIIESQQPQTPQEPKPPQIDLTEAIAQLERQHESQVQTMQTALSTSNRELTAEQEKSSTLQQDLNSSRAHCKELMNRIAELEAAASVESSSVATVHQLTQSLNASDAQRRHLEERIDILASAEQQIITGLSIFTKHINDAPQRNSLIHHSSMNENAKHILLQCSHAIEERCSSERSNAHAEVASNDANTCDQIETLKNQCLQQQNRITALEAQLSDISSLCDTKYEEYESTILQLEISLSNATRSLEAADRHKQQADEWQKKFIEKEIAWTQLSMDHATVTQDLIGQQQLVDVLKRKLKELSGAKENNFSDTFEEVMREEMLTMKMAFEAKLKAAREAADVNSRRYQLEISKMQQGGGSPSSTMLKSSSSHGIYTNKPNR